MKHPSHQDRAGRGHMCMNMSLTKPHLVSEFDRFIDLFISAHLSFVSAVSHSSFRTISFASFSSRIASSARARSSSDPPCAATSGCISRDFARKTFLSRFSSRHPASSRLRAREEGIGHRGHQGDDKRGDCPQNNLKPRSASSSGKFDSLSRRARSSSSHSSLAHAWTALKSRARPVERASERE